jgi:hypothetical protein
MLNISLRIDTASAAMVTALLYYSAFVNQRIKTDPELISLYSSMLEWWKAKYWIGRRVFVVYPFHIQLLGKRGMQTHRLPTPISPHLQLKFLNLPKQLQWT